MSQFEMGACSISPLAQKELSERGMNANEFFSRHRRGEWGEVDGRVAGENAIAITKEKSLLPITSRHHLGPDVELLIITSTDRSFTYLQVASEYEVREATTREGYAAWAPLYDPVPNLLINVESPSFQAILDRLLPVKSAIDVATGTGRQAFYLAAQGVEVLGIDDSEEMLAMARSRALAEQRSNPRFLQATLGKEPLPVESASFDLLTCSLMLCHLPTLKEEIKECVRTVRNNGHLLISDFHPDAIGFGWRSAFPTPKVHYNFPTTNHTRQGYLDALMEAGCKILEVHDLAVDGQPYGEISEAALVAKGNAPFCLIILAQKE